MERLTGRVSQMGEYVDFYCGNNNKELKRIVNPILIGRFGWVSQKDYDDFYSLAALVVWECEKKFNKEDQGSEEFKRYLSKCILNRIKSRITYMHRNRRVMKDNEGNPVYEISIDTPFEGSDGSTLGDMLVGDFDIEREVLGGKEPQYSTRMRTYLNRLSSLQKRVLELITEGFLPDEIKTELHITGREYADCCEAIHSYRNVSALL